MKILINVEIDESRQKKIAYDLGNYANDLPDETECEDWLNQMIEDKFDELHEARGVQ